MCKNDPKVHDLPTDLQQLVYMFAFNLPKHDVQCSLNTFLEIREWELPFFFFRDQIWSWHCKEFLPSPLKVFLPIEYYGGSFREIFDADSVYCFLLALDFRMRNVRKFGNRQRWENRILLSWRVMDSLASYYWMLMRSKTRVLRRSLYAMPPI